MADITKEKQTLNLEAEFVDGDTRSITLDNPKASLTAEQIDALAPIMVKCLKGDKNDATFLRWKTAKVVDKVTTEYDLQTSP